MLEYLVVVVIVVWAIWITGRRLRRQVTRGQCDACQCGAGRQLRRPLTHAEVSTNSPHVPPSADHTG